MSHPGKEQSHPPDSLTCDSDVCAYLRDRMRGANTDFDRSPLLEYAEERDFKVEPLETGTAAYLINILVDNASARPAGKYAIECWIPLENKLISKLDSRFEQWGYGIIDVSRTNRSTHGRSVIEITARQLPCPLHQFEAIGEIVPDPETLLDGWVVVIQNRHRHSGKEIRPVDWAKIRDVRPQVITENIKHLEEEIRKQGGIPGTQWAIRESGGVPITTD